MAKRVFIAQRQGSSLLAVIHAAAFVPFEFLFKLNGFCVYLEISNKRFFPDGENCEEKEDFINLHVCQARPTKYRDEVTGGHSE